jgi:hypothetical protein
LLLDELFPLEDALARFGGGIFIRLRPEDRGVLDSLMSSLRAHSGKQPLYLQVTGSDGSDRRVRAGSEWRVRISSDLAREVDRVLGRVRVSLARV